MQVERVRPEGTAGLTNRSICIDVYRRNEMVVHATPLVKKRKQVHCGKRMLQRFTKK